MLIIYFLPLCPRLKSGCVHPRKYHARSSLSSGFCFTPDQDLAYNHITPSVPTNSGVFLQASNSQKACQAVASKSWWLDPAEKTLSLQGLPVHMFLFFWWPNLPLWDLFALAFSWLAGGRCWVGESQRWLQYLPCWYLLQHPAGSPLEPACSRWTKLWRVLRLF